MYRTIFKDWAISLFAWVLITNLYAMAVLTNMEILSEIAGLKEFIEGNLMATYFTSYYQYLEATIFGVVFGTLFYWINFLFDNMLGRKIPFGKIIFLKTVMYIVALIIVSFSMYVIFTVFDIYPFDMREFFMQLGNKSTLHLTLAFFTFILFTSVLINFLTQVSKKFGPKNVLPMFLGKYHQPKSENRIFLFLDLKDSTGLAEELGHIRYSKLLQECYYDLNKVIYDMNAEVYQYVGDEAVLTWINNRKNLNKYAIRTTFAFRDHIEKRKKEYLKKYGVVPEFKGGLNLGVVSVAEIGDIKRDIAYHGDVLNTASRLQEAAKQYEKTLMVAENVIRELSDYGDLKVGEMGTVPLKGKKKQLNVYCMETADHVESLEKSVV